MTVLDPDVPASPQHNELAVGVTLRVLRHLLGNLHRPVRAHLQHQPMASPADYLKSFGCRDQSSTALAREGMNNGHAHRASKISR
ncbi:AraC family transcriptional regulator ligand-binding domain-containing protein [Mycobacterium antarcticum]|uniref:AraC family transcriptional regulator ligand-binding domain-containing protein n=1 Tax=unclassified Mycolicibacterium TaxID=2636767 RepID=UPI0032EA0AAF